jgi:dynactin 1
MTTQNKDLTIDRDSAQTKFEDLQEQVEHSLLDKEIAESELEEAQAKVKELEERVGELEVEVEVVREENGASRFVASVFISSSLLKERD